MQNWTVSSYVNTLHDKFQITWVRQRDVRAEKHQDQGHEEVMEGEEEFEEVAVAIALVPHQMDVVLYEERGHEYAVQEIHYAQSQQSWNKILLV